MKNKKVLIILGVVLLLTIVLLTVYALTLKQPLPTEPSQIKPSQTSQFQKDLEEKEKEKLELEKIKRGLANIKNESLVLKDITPETEECNTEEAQAYEEKVKTGTAKVVQGIVKEKINSSIKIEFNQNSFSWTSTVKTDQDTLLETIDRDFKKQNISLSDIQIGDTLVVKSKENITGESFVAVSIYKLN